MILLDTNVVSEVMAPTPNEPVLEWLDQRETETLYISTVTIAEIEYGLAALPDGRRRRTLSDRFERFLTLGFAQRVLPFDETAARLYGRLMGRRRKLGRPMSVLDGQIAAIAKAHRLALATRNVRDFEECGLEIFNSFETDG
jgi:predicted nucleic acid-binding protein